MAADGTPAATNTNGAPTDRWLGLPFWMRRVGGFCWLFVGFIIAFGTIMVLFAATSAIVVPVVLAIALAVVFAPAVEWLADHRFNRSLAAVAVLLGLVAIVALVVYITSAALVDQADELSDNLSKAVDDIKGWLQDTPIDEKLADQTSETTTDGGPALASGLAGGAVSVLGGAAALVSGIVLAMITLYYLLKSGPTFAANRKEPTDDRQATKYRIADDAVRDLRGYFRGQTGIALMNGAAIGVSAAIIGVPAAVALGVVNFFCAYIPYLGGFFGGAFAVLMALGGGGLGLAVLMLALTLGVNLLLENLLQPVLIGDSLDVGPLPILLATTLGGMVAGMVGLVLAAPILAIVVDARRELRASGFFAEPAAGATTGDGAKSEPQIPSTTSGTDAQR